MSEEELSVYLFKSPDCVPCEFILKSLRKIVESSALKAKIQVIDTHVNQELAERFNVRNVPHVLVAGAVILTAQQASGIISGSVNSFQQEPSTQEFSFESSEVETPQISLEMDQDMQVFNYLFNGLTDARIEGFDRDRWKKLMLMSIYDREKTKEDRLTRRTVGDYVHIGILQSMTMSILSIQPESRRHLKEAGDLNGRYSLLQNYLMRANSQISASHTASEKFGEILKGFERYSTLTRQRKFPYYEHTVQKTEKITDKSGRIYVADSAYASGNTFGSPVCDYLAGEIQGVIHVLLGEDIHVYEEKCLAAGDEQCIFHIDVGEASSKQSKEATRDFFTGEDRKKFESCLGEISDNTYHSSLMSKTIRPNIGHDFVHISVIQQLVNSVKFADPFNASLLYFGGYQYGVLGRDINTLRDILSRKGDISLPVDFEEGCRILEAYYDHPTTLFSRQQGLVELELIDDETAEFTIYEDAMASGLDFSSETFLPGLVDSMTHLNPVCDFQSGFIHGRLNLIIEEDLEVKETECQVFGQKQCKHKVSLD